MKLATYKSPLASIAGPSIPVVNTAPVNLVDCHKVTDDTEEDDELFTLEIELDEDLELTIELDDFELTVELEDLELILELEDLELTTELDDELELGALLDDEITLDDEATIEDLLDDDTITEDILEDTAPSQGPFNVHSDH